MALETTEPTDQGTEKPQVRGRDGRYAGFKKKQAGPRAGLTSEQNYKTPTSPLLSRHPRLAQNPQRARAQRQQQQHAGNHGRCLRNRLSTDQ